MAFDDPRRRGRKVNALRVARRGAKATLFNLSRTLMRLSPILFPHIPCAGHPWKTSNRSMWIGVRFLIFLPLQILVTEHRAEHKQCPHCGCSHQAEYPAEAAHPMQYGINLKTFLVYFCLYQLLPYDRASEMVFDLFGHSLSQATVVATVGEFSQKLTGVEERIRELLQGAHILHVDETGMRVGGTRHWLHVARTEHLTYYGCHRKRGAQATDAMGVLPAFLGTMIMTPGGRTSGIPVSMRSATRISCANSEGLRRTVGISGAKRLVLSLSR